MSIGLSDKYDESYVETVINNDFVNETLNSNNSSLPNKLLSADHESTTDLDDICTSVSQIPPNPLYSKTITTGEIILPETKFWREQANGYEEQNLITRKANEASQINIDEHNFFLSSASSTDLSFTPNKPKNKLPTAINKWRVYLSGGNLLFTGYIKNGLKLIGRICARRISSHIFHDNNNTVCSLIGPIQPDVDLPKYIQERFKSGIPEDWLRIVDAWREYIISDSPEKFKWPSIYLTPTYNHVTNNYELPDINSTIIDANCTSLSTLQLKKKIAKMQTRLNVMLLKESVSGLSQNSVDSVSHNLIVPKTNLTNRLENLNIDRSTDTLNINVSNSEASKLNSLLNSDNNTKIILYHTSKTNKLVEIAKNPVVSEELDNLSDESIHLGLSSSENNKKSQPEIILEEKSQTHVQKLNSELKTKKLPHNQTKHVKTDSGLFPVLNSNKISEEKSQNQVNQIIGGFEKTKKLKNHANQASSESFTLSGVKNKKTSGCKASDSVKAINDNRKSIKTYDNHIVPSCSASHDSLKFSKVNKVSFIKDSTTVLNKKESVEDKNIENLDNSVSINSRRRNTHPFCQGSPLKLINEENEIISGTTSNEQILNGSFEFRKPDNSLKKLGRKKISMPSTKILEPPNEETLTIKNTKQEKLLKKIIDTPVNENDNNILTQGVVKRTGRERDCKKPEISQEKKLPKYTVKIYKSDISRSVSTFSETNENNDKFILKSNTAKKAGRKKDWKKLTPELSQEKQMPENNIEIFEKNIDLPEQLPPAANKNIDNFLRPGRKKDWKKPIPYILLERQLPENSPKMVKNNSEQTNFHKEEMYKKSCETKKLFEFTPKSSTSKIIPEKLDKDVLNTQETSVFLTPAQPKSRSRKVGRRKNSVNNIISTSDISSNNSNFSESLSNLRTDSLRLSNVSSDSFSNTSVSSRGRIRVPTLSFWQGQRVSVFKSEVLVQTSRTEKCSIENLVDNNSLLLSDTSSKRSNSFRKNHSNNNADSVSNVLKIPKPKISQQTTINDLKNNDSVVNISSSPVKRQISTSKLDKEIIPDTKRSISPIKSTKKIKKSALNNEENDAENLVSNLSVRITRSQSKNKVRKQLNYSSSNETLPKQSPLIKISARNQIKNTSERPSIRKQLKYTSEVEKSDVLHSFKNKRSSKKKPLVNSSEKVRNDSTKMKTRKPIKYIPVETNNTSVEQLPNKKRLKTTEISEKQAPITPKNKFVKEKKNILPENERQTRSQGKKVNDKISAQVDKNKKIEDVKELESSVLKSSINSEPNYSRILNNTQTRYNIRQNRRTTYFNPIYDVQYSSYNKIRKKNQRKSYKTPKKSRNDINKNTVENHFNFTQEIVGNVEEKVEKNKKNKSLGLKNKTQFKVSKPKKLNKSILPLNLNELCLFVSKDKKKSKAQKPPTIPNRTSEKTGKKKRIFFNNTWLQSEECQAHLSQINSESEVSPKFVLKYIPVGIETEGDDQFSEVSIVV